MATRYAELMARVEAAREPDRELDLALATALVPDVLVLRQRDDDSGSDPYTHWKYTGSIDDAIMLVARVLPGWQVNIYHYGSAGAQASLGGNPQERHEAITAPLAIVLAMLRALASIESKP